MAQDATSGSGVDRGPPVPDTSRRRSAELFGGVRLGQVAGIEVRVDWSVLVIAALITWTLAVGLFPAAVEDAEPVLAWLVAVTTALAFLASLLAHELAHSIVARRNGIRVESITLWVLGGVARIYDEPPTPGIEARMALVGPATSGALAAVFALGAVALGLVPGTDLVVAGLAWLATINLVLAIFNLVPAAPLDGGRVLRAILWRRRGDHTSATVSAARGGRIFGYVLVAGGVLELLAGLGVGGIWLLFLGWFVISAARAEEGDAVLRAGLIGVRVRDVMTPDPVVVHAGTTVQELLDEHLLARPHTTFPVVDAAGDAVGLVTLRRVREVTPQRRPVVTAGEIAWSIDDVPQARPDELLLDVLRRAEAGADDRILVFADHRVVGIVAPVDVARAAGVSDLRRRSS